MKVLTIYAHHNPQSLCHAILERFSEGLREAGHEHEVVDLHAIGFDPVLRDADGPNWIDDSVPDDVLDNMAVRETILARADTRLKRFLAERWLGTLTPKQIVAKIHASGGPRDVAVQQSKVAAADALVFIAPVYFLGFPAILKGWIERVFTLDFAFGMTPEAWRGDIRGRVPLLRHRKALVINTTIFDEASYDDRLRAAMTTQIDDFALHFPGIAKVEHVYFHAVYGASPAQRQAWLDRAYQLGLTFAD
jgi:NAD(P)H dehydrogenase (quinone)